MATISLLNVDDPSICIDDGWFLMILSVPTYCNCHNCNCKQVCTKPTNTVFHITFSNVKEVDGKPRPQSLPQCAILCATRPTSDNGSHNASLSLPAASVKSQMKVNGLWYSRKSGTSNVRTEMAPPKQGTARSSPKKPKFEQLQADHELFLQAFESECYFINTGQRGTVVLS